MMVKRYWLYATAMLAAIVLSACATPGTTGQAADSNQAARGGRNTAPETVMNWYGGPAHVGEPALATTAALVRAGGGAQDFDFATALVAMLGRDTLDVEMTRLRRQYGNEAVETFITGINYAITDGLQRASQAGVALPDAAPGLNGRELAKALVDAGTAADGTFWAGRLFDVAISHELHNQVMTDIDATFGAEADLLTHQILNQTMYDVAQILGLRHVKLAPLH